MNICGWLGLKRLHCLLQPPAYRLFGINKGSTINPRGLCPSVTKNAFIPSSSWKGKKNMFSLELITHLSCISTVTLSKRFWRGYGEQAIFIMKRTGTSSLLRSRSSSVRRWPWPLGKHQGLYAFCISLSSFSASDDSAKYSYDFQMV